MERILESLERKKPKFKRNCEQLKPSSEARQLENHRKRLVSHDATFTCALPNVACVFQRMRHVGTVCFRHGPRSGRRNDGEFASVTQGDMLRLTLTFVNCKVKEIEPPQIKGLEWRMGPSTSTSTQWINGVTTSEQSYTYGYTVTAGNELQIPSFNWRTNKGCRRAIRSG